MLNSENQELKLVVNSNNNYELLLRYATQKESISSYSIKVKPYLWQTLAFKLIIGSALILLFTGIFLYTYVQKKKIQNIQSEAALKQSVLELKSLQAQLNPHFVFNSLNSIQGLMNTGKIEAANQYLSEFSMLMRATLNDSEKVFSTIASEIKKLEQYLNLEQLRFGFTYSITTNESINISSTEIPTLLLQPIAENAIKHGIAEMASKGTIDIHFSQNNSTLIVTIADNGKGFNNDENKEGYGLKLTAERIKLINTIYKDSFVEQKISSDNNGTIVTINFNQWL